MEPTVCRPTQRCTIQPDWRRRGWPPSARNCPVGGTSESVPKSDVDAMCRWSIGWCCRSCSCRWWSPRMWTMAQRHGCAYVGIRWPTFREVCHRWPIRTVEMVHWQGTDRNRYLGGAVLDLKRTNKKSSVEMAEQKHSVNFTRKINKNQTNEKSTRVDSQTKGQLLESLTLSSTKYVGTSKHSSLDYTHHASGHMMIKKNDYKRLTDFNFIVFLLCNSRTKIVNRLFDPVKWITSERCKVFSCSFPIRNMFLRFQ